MSRLLMMIILILSSLPQIGATMDTTQHDEAIFAGGCFWCMQPPFDKTPGVIDTIVGYTAGHQANPTYESVSAGGTGHTEAIKVIFNPEQVSYAQLLDIFWRNIDPEARDRQFCDVGSQYRSGIYYRNAQQQAAAESSRDKLAASGKVNNIHTEIAAATTFYPAEDYHQDYYKKNPKRYQFYRWNCGRDKRLKAIWG